jgi:hypothetical protein
MRMTAKVTLVLVLVLSAIACGDDDNDPTPTPTPTLRALRFTPSSPSGESQSYWLTSQNQDAPTLNVDINARFSAGCAPSKFRGTLVFDDALLKVLNYSDGVYFQQGGAVVTTFVSNATAGRVVIRLDRPDSTGGVSGQGVAITIRFQAKDQTTGTSPIQWTDTNAYTPSFTDCLLVARNASITVQ